jgi:hypothetical protein
MAMILRISKVEMGSGLITVNCKGNRHPTQAVEGDFRRESGYLAGGSRSTATRALKLAQALETCQLAAAQTVKLGSIGSTSPRRRSSGRFNLGCARRQAGQQSELVQLVETPGKPKLMQDEGGSRAPMSPDPKRRFRFRKKGNESLLASHW